MCGEGEHLFVVAGAIESLDCVKRVRLWVWRLRLNYSVDERLEVLETHNVLKPIPRREIGWIVPHFIRFNGCSSTPSAYSNAAAATVAPIRRLRPISSFTATSRAAAGRR